MKFNFLVPHLRPLVIWLLPTLPILNPLTLLHIPFVPHIPLPELVFRVAQPFLFCALSMPFPSHCPHCPPRNPCRSHSPILHTWSPPSQNLTGYHRLYPELDMLPCLLTIKLLGILPAPLLWSLLIFTLCFGDLCILSDDISGLDLQGLSSLFSCLSQ